MVRKELVITSDDLGMTSSINRGIELACRQGSLTSTNLMVPCPWFEHAVDRFRGVKIDLGVHLTLTCDWQHFRWRPLTRGKSLVDSQGAMYSTIAQLMEHATAEDLRSECREQISRAIRTELPISYVDLHMCIPTFSDASALVNPDYELALMRIVEDVASETGLVYPYALRGGALKFFSSAFSITGKGRARIEQYIQSLTAGLHHLSCHCSIASMEQESLTSQDDQAYPWAMQFRLEDLDCITSSWFRGLLKRCDVHLTRMPFLQRADQRDAASNQY